MESLTRAGWALAIATGLTVAMAGASCFVRPRLEEARYERRRDFWKNGLQRIVTTPLQPGPARSLLERMGGKVVVSPRDPESGRFKLDVMDEQTFDFEFTGRTRAAPQLVYDASGKPIGFSVKGEIVPR